MRSTRLGVRPEYVEHVADATRPTSPTTSFWRPGASFVRDSRAGHAFEHMPVWTGAVREIRPTLSPRPPRWIHDRRHDRAAVLGWGFGARSELAQLVDADMALECERQSRGSTNDRQLWNIAAPPQSARSEPRQVYRRASRLVRSAAPRGRGVRLLVRSRRA